jgi:undecaprenyl-diphosphatase
VKLGTGLLSAKQADVAKPKRTSPSKAELRLRSDPVDQAFEALVDRVGSLLGALGIFLIAGVIVAGIGAWGFSELAETVMSGRTQKFDEAVLRWAYSLHTPTLDSVMLEITTLGTGTVVLMIVAVAALFLTLTQHKYSALLLIVASSGGLLLDMWLKHWFGRPRPHVFVWTTQAFGSSFPSGHAMGATIAYSTVAYLAARLHKRLWARFVTMFIALLVIFLICFSRLYLGVHYPSDVLAGVIIGLAWAAFCMATLEGIQRFSQRRSPEVMKDEAPAPSVKS